jgi:hypothetical protein
VQKGIAISLPESTRKLKYEGFFSTFLNRKRIGRRRGGCDNGYDFGFSGEDILMRYYLPTREKTSSSRTEEGSPSFALPLWIWISLVVLLLFLVIALR